MPVTHELDAQIGDVFVSHNGVDIYYLFKDADDESRIPYTYWFTTELNNCLAEFDVRKLSCYDKDLSIEDVIVKAIDLDLIDYSYYNN